MTSGSWSVPASCIRSSMPGSWLCEVPEKRWYRGKHRVGLAATEVGLKLDNRVAVIVGQALYAVDQELPQAVGQKGATEELGGILVFGDPAAQVDLPEVSCELSLLILSRRPRPDEDLSPPARVAAHPSLGYPPTGWWCGASGSGPVH